MSNPFFQASIPDIFGKTSIQNAIKSDSLLSKFEKENGSASNPFLVNDQSIGYGDLSNLNYSNSNEKKFLNPFLEKNDGSDTVQNAESFEKKINNKQQSNPFLANSLIDIQSKKISNPSSIHVSLSLTAIPAKVDPLSSGPVAPLQNKSSMEPALTDGTVGSEKVYVAKRSVKTLINNTAQMQNFQLSLQKLVEKLRLVKCVSSASKFEVLDAIDKAIRKGLQDVNKRCKAFKGCCRDMCPEKERYLREERRQGSPFETEFLVDCVAIDHQKAVKEYSRSSADQEEPLPHELRPASVLRMTMNYLVRNIMDEKYVVRYDWFDFIWNRLRAIRKDITQQNLKNLASIELMEKCARFHIFCSHHLCEEDLQIFDPKINLENLTKCLQTLKHMYEDLWNEKGICSPNEVEFRCYQILLNLNNADTLREAVCFREDVRRSHQVKFALQVFLSVQEKNYVRFFKLLKLSSFLNASLLHSYFNQMREVALNTMTHAFCRGKKDTPYLLARLQHLLCFNDINELKVFCSHFGLSVDSTNVYLNQGSLVSPDEQFIQRKSRIITEKCITSISEVINGGDLPKEGVYIPTNSFSEDGYYIGSYHILSDDHDSEEEVNDLDNENEENDQKFSENKNVMLHGYLRDEENVREEDSQSSKTQKVEYNDESEHMSSSIKEQLGKGLSHVADPDFILTEDDYLQEIEDNEGKEANSSHHLMILREDYKKFRDTMLENFLTDEILIIASEFLNEFKEFMSQALGASNQMLAFSCIEESRAIAIEVIEEEKEDERFQMLNEASNIIDCLIDDCVYEVLKDCCIQVLSETTYHEENVLKSELLNVQQQSIIDNVVREMVLKIAQKIINEMIAERKKKLQYNFDCFQERKLKIYFKRWMVAYKSCTYLKTTLCDFPPAAPLFESAENLMKKLHLPIKNIYSQDKFLRISDDISLPSFKEEMENRIKVLQKPLDLHQIVKNKMEQNFFPNDTVWKLGIINLPNQQSKQNVHTVSSNMLKEKFRNISKCSKIAPNILYESYIKHQSLQTLVIVESILKNEDDRVRDFSGLIYFIELTTNEIREELQSAKDLFHRHLKLYKKPTVLAVITSNVSLSYIEDQLELNHLNQLGYKCHFVLINEELRLASNIDCVLTSLIEWLLVNCSWNVVTKSLSAFLEDYLNLFFFKVFHKHIFYCQQTHLSYPMPNDVIQFFNNTLESMLESIRISSAVQQDNFISQAQDLVSAMRLPLLSAVKINDWEASYLLLVEYVSKVAGNNKTILLQRLEMLIDSRANMKRAMHTNEDFPWCVVLEECIIHRLSSIYYTNDFLMLGYFHKELFRSTGSDNILVSHSRQNQKIRKVAAEAFKRELSIKNTIEDINAALDPIQNTLRKRKSIELTSNNMIQNSSVDILNDSSALLKDVFDHKNECLRKRRLLSYYLNDEI